MKASLRRLIPIFSLAWIAALLPRQLGIYAGDLGDPLAWAARWTHLSNLYGQSLRYGTPIRNLSYQMPLSSLLADVARAHPGTWGTSLALLVWLAPAFLAYAIASTLAGTEAAWLAAAMAAGLDPRSPLAPGDGLNFETALYACLLTCVAAALLRGEGRPSWRDSALIGWTVGLSLLCRSPLFLFPLALLMYEWSRRGQASPRTFLREFLPVAIVPALVLAPWVYMNGRIFGRFILFENGREVYNLLTGAAGFIKTSDDPLPALLGLPSIPEHPYRLAAYWVLAHPFRYALAYISRVAYAFSMYPVLWTASLWILWKDRQRPAVRRLALLAGYFVGIHCLMPIEQRYFQPLWPLLSALAAAAVAGIIFAAKKPRESSILDGVFAAELAPLSLAGLWALCLVAAYPSRLNAYTRDPDALSTGNPGDPWPWTLQGMRLESQGELCGASQAYAHALRLLPTDDNLADYRRTTRASLDNRLLILPAAAAGAPRSRPFDLVAQNALSALEFLSQGNTGAARGAVQALKHEWFEPACRPHAVTFEAIQPRVLKSLAREDSLKRMAALMSDWPGPDRSDILRRLMPYAKGA